MSIEDIEKTIIKEVKEAFFKKKIDLIEAIRITKGIYIVENKLSVAIEYCVNLAMGKLEKYYREKRNKKYNSVLAKNLHRKSFKGFVEELKEEGFKDGEFTNLTLSDSLLMDEGMYRYEKNNVLITYDNRWWLYEDKDENMGAVKDRTLKLSIELFESELEVFKKENEELKALGMSQG